MNALMLLNCIVTLPAHLDTPTRRCPFRSGRDIPVNVGRVTSVDPLKGRRIVQVQFFGHADPWHYTLTEAAAFEVNSHPSVAGHHSTGEKVMEAGTWFPDPQPDANVANN